MTLTQLWGWSPELEWTGGIKVGKEMKPVYGPAFAIFGSSTERAFFLALKAKLVSNGFVNRHLLFNAGRGAARRIKPKGDWLQIAGRLAKGLKEIAGPLAGSDNRPKPLKNAQGEVTLCLNDFRRIGWGEGAEEAWYEFENELRGLPSVEERELWIRAPRSR